MKTLKLKKEVVSILNSDESSKIRGGAESQTVIPNTQYCHNTNTCETGLCDTGVSCPCILTKDCQVTNDGCKISDAEDCPLRTIINCEG